MSMKFDVTQSSHQLGVSGITPDKAVSSQGLGFLLNGLRNWEYPERWLSGILISWIARMSTCFSPTVELRSAVIDGWAKWWADRAFELMMLRARGWGLSRHWALDRERSHGGSPRSAKKLYFAVTPSSMHKNSNTGGSVERFPYGIKKHDLLASNFKPMTVSIWDSSKNPLWRTKGSTAEVKHLGDCAGFSEHYIWECARMGKWSSWYPRTPNAR